MQELTCLCIIIHIQSHFIFPILGGLHLRYSLIVIYFGYISGFSDSALTSGSNHVNFLLCRVVSRTFPVRSRVHP